MRLVVNYLKKLHTLKNSKIEPIKNHPMEKDNHLPNLHFGVQNVDVQVCKR